MSPNKNKKLYFNFIYCSATIQYNSLLTLPWWGFSVTMRLKKKLIEIREVVNNSIKKKECGEQSYINIPI